MTWAAFTASFNAFSLPVWAALVAAAFGGALLTFFSGFGLGTILLPVFALFFPPAEAVTATAVVHFTTNVFKLGLLWRSIDRQVLRTFALTAVPASLGGAWLLGWLTHQAPLFTWTLAGRACAVLPVDLAIALAIAAFALLELVPATRLPPLKPEHLPLGGLLSGFFGGLSGHQGALRSLFLVKAGLGPAGYVATGVGIALLVDLARLAVYAGQAGPEAGSLAAGPLLVGVVAAIAGAWVGGRWLHKVTLAGLQRLVAGLLLGYAAGLGLGLL
ncbi:MAG: TSUP family transporter [Candidatus Sericytochromatia bacterium]|nr:TSUP family transporter [Candidatus Sericytochromatia bacterium]